MSTSNRSKDLLSDLITELEAASAVTSALPNGAGDIHPGVVPRDRDAEADLIVTLIGGSAERQGVRAVKTRLVQVRLEAARDFYESKPTSWLYDLFDAIEVECEGLGGPARAPDGQAGGLGPVYDAERGRYLADQTFRYATIH